MKPITWWHKQVRQRKLIKVFKFQLGFFMLKHFICEHDIPFYPLYNVISKSKAFDAKLKSMYTIFVCSKMIKKDI